MPSAKRWASSSEGGRVLASVASSSKWRQSGTPSRRQNSEKAQRGSGSPGYHLPSP